MSKQSEAKERQNYQTKPPEKECRSCFFFTIETKYPTKPKYLIEKNMRCGVGGFEVTPNAVCDLWQDLYQRDEQGE